MREHGRKFFPILALTLLISHAIPSQGADEDAAKPSAKSPFSSMFVPVEDPPLWWQKGVYADRLYEDQPQHAKKFYKEALDDAIKANAEPRSILSLTYYYGNNLDSPDALPIYKQGAKLAETTGCKGWQATFLQAIGICEKNIALEGKSGKADLSPLLQALELKPGDPKIPSTFRATCYETLGESYRTNGDLASAEKYTQLAISEYEQLGDAYGDLAGLKCEMSIVRLEQGRKAEAIQLLAEACKMFPSNIRGVTNAYMAVQNDSKEVEISSAAKKLFLEKKFKELDDYADKLRASKLILPTGKLPVEIIYDALSVDAMSEDELKKHIEVIRSWIKFQPNSPTPKILLALSLKDYAWRARGSGFSNTVTNEGWKLMQDRINEAWALLQQVKPRPVDWYFAASKVSFGKSIPHNEYDAIVAESRERFPYSERILFSKAYWLQEKWFGGAGEADRFIASEVAKRTGADADIFYVRMMLYLDPLITDPTGRKDFDWPRMKRGLQELAKRFPDSASLQTLLLSYAFRMDDKATLLTLGVK